MDPVTAVQPDAPGLLQSIWRFKVLVAVLCIAGAAAGYGLALREAPVYEATARLLLADPRNAGLPGSNIRVVSDAGRYIRNQAEMIRSGAVYPVAVELIDGRLNEVQVAGRVRVEGFNDIDLIVITASDDTAAGAAELATAVGQAYERVVAAQVQQQAAAGIAELEARNRALREELDRINRTQGSTAPDAGTDPRIAAERQAAIDQIVQNEGRIEQLVVDAALFGSGVEVLTPAREPAGPSRPRPRTNAAAGFILAGVAAAGLAWWRNSMTQVVARPADAAAILGAPLLGEVPHFAKFGYKGSLPTVDEPHSVPAEAYQFITGAMLLAVAEDLAADDGAILLVTSALPGDGKTVTSLNLAIAAGRDGRSVAVLDVDQRAYGLTRLVRDSVPLSHPEVDEALESGAEWLATPLPLADDVDVTLVSPGTRVPDPASYFRSATFRRRLAWLGERNDLVIIDAPPVLAVAETAAVATRVDGVILVVNRGTPVRLLREVRSRMALVGAPLVGYVFNRSIPRHSPYGYLQYGYAVRGESPLGTAASSGAAASNGAGQGAEVRPRPASRVAAQRRPTTWQSDPA
jgi:Mrp family chromosome partitioning ATPase/capsular polysaccharide biosynthesis protein